MSEFLERNKKKGVLAVALAFLKRGRGVAPMAAMTAILAVVFVMPSGVQRHIPSLGRWADNLGLSGYFRPASPEFSNFNEAVNNARQNRDDIDRLMSVPPTRSPSVGPSYSGSLGLVQKAPKEVEQGARVNGPGSRSVDGVLRPEDAKKMPEGVALKEGELHNGLTNNNALAGAISGLGPAAFAGQMGLKDKNVASGARISAGKADDKQANLLQHAVNPGNIPSALGYPVKGAGKGVKAPVNWSRPNTSLSNATGPQKSAGKDSAIYQLAQGRAYSIAASPTGLCKAGSCPSEYAANAAGTVFDGKRAPTGGILGNPPELGETGAETPSGDSIGGLTDQASQLEEDQKKCEAADQNGTYGLAALQKAMDAIQKDSDELNANSCGGGGCGSKPCNDASDKLKADCKTYNDLAKQHADACPLTHGQVTTHDCNAYN